MIDKRIETLAASLVNYSCAIKKGEKLLIEAKGIDYMLINAIVKETYKAGAYPFVEIFDNRVSRELLLGETEEYAKLKAKYDGYRMAEMDAYIGIRGGENCNENSDVPEKNLQIDSEFYMHPVHHELRVKKTKWVILRYPNQGMAQQAGMSTDAFEDFYFNVCNLDYSKMDKAMDALKARLDAADKVRIIAKDTDISFSIKGIGSKKCSGEHNIPDGEIKGIFHLVHGMCEYIGRYAHVFAALAEKGYVCCGYDNLGHGKTAKCEEELGFISRRNGWKYLVKDVAAFEEAVKKMYPGKPLFLPAAEQRGRLLPRRFARCGQRA